MANVSKIKLPSGDTYDIKDSRLGNAKIFYGTCATAAGTADKVVVCPEFTQSDLVKGALIFVTFDASNSAAVANLTLNVNSTTAKPLKKQENSSSANNLAAVGELRANSTYLFQYDGTNWVCMTLDYNSTYSALTEADMEAGTATTGRTITAARLKQAVEYWMAQNQSDWSETDTDSPSYIQNKPTNVSSFTNDAGYTTNIGTVTNVVSGTGLTGGSITTTGTIAVDTTVIATKTDLEEYVTVSDYEQDEEVIAAAFNDINDRLRTKQDVLTIANTISSASTNDQVPSAKAVYDNVSIKIQSSQPAGGFLPNVFYSLGELSGDTTFYMAAASDNTILNHWYWTFDTPSTVPTITWPAAITKWVGGSAPTLTASTHYEISVINGIAAYLEV